MSTPTNETDAEFGTSESVHINIEDSTKGPVVPTTNVNKPELEKDETIGRQLSSSSSTDSTTSQPKNSQSKCHTSPNTGRPNPSSETANGLVENEKPRIEDAIATTSKGFGSQPSKCNVVGKTWTPNEQFKLRSIPVYTGKTTTARFKNYEIKCSVSYVGREKSAATKCCEARTSTCHFGGTVPKTTTTTSLSNAARSTQYDTKRYTRNYNRCNPYKKHQQSAYLRSQMYEHQRFTSYERSSTKTSPLTNVLNISQRKCSACRIGGLPRRPYGIVGMVLPPVIQDGEIPPEIVEAPREVPNYDLDRQTPSCRICHDDISEPLITPCRCKGTIAHVHHSCLTRWLSQDITRTFQCELCQYRFPILEARQYTMLESIRIWSRDPQNKERFVSFICVSGFITIINMIVYVTAFVVMRYTSLSTAPDWFIACMFLFLVLLYVWNVVQCFKDTIFDHWYRWWNNCVNISLDLEQIMVEGKIKTRSEESPGNSGSCNSLHSCCIEIGEVDLPVRKI